MIEEPPHRQETYKTLVTLAVEAVKFCALANGGAVVALLAYLGNVHAKAPQIGAPNLLGAITWFLGGLAFSGVLVAASYATQVLIFNDSFQHSYIRKDGRHKLPHRVAVGAFVLSLGCFVAGAWSAVAAWSQQATLTHSSPTGASAPTTTPTASGSTPRKSQLNGK